MPAQTATAIQFTAKIVTIGSMPIVRVPADASKKLPSRGQAMVRGTFNDIPFQTPLEPDGNWSHWFRVDAKLLHQAQLAPGDRVSITMTPVEQWPDPDLPKDLEQAIHASPTAHELWQRITPMARWEWVRWTRSTNKAETRQRRIQVAISKLTKGERRPCCWNRNLCTEPSVSKNGVLLEPDA